MSLILRTIFRDDFATDSNQDPLNPVNWDKDLDVNYNGALCVTGGLCGVDPASLANQVQSLQWWHGSAPDDVFIAVKIGSLDLISNGSSLRAFYRSTADDNGYKVGGYQWALNGQNGGGAIALEKRGPGGGTVGSFPVPAVSVGDVFIFAVVGSTHYAYQNGILLKTLSDGTFIVGGPGTVGIMSEPNANFVDATFSDFRTGHVKSVTLGQDGIFADLLILP